MQLLRDLSIRTIGVVALGQMGSIKAGADQFNDDRVISLRGKIIPVYDLALRLGLHAEPRSDQKIVIVETAAGTAGVIVDAVEEVLTVDATQLDEVPGTGSDAIDAIAKVDDRLVVLLARDRLLDGVGDAAYA